MKFTVAVLLAALANTTCFAQTVIIASPLNRTVVYPGQNLNVILTCQDSPEDLTVSLYTQAAGWLKPGLPNRTEIDRTPRFLWGYGYAISLALWLAGRIQFATILSHMYTITTVRIHSTT